MSQAREMTTNFTEVDVSRLSFTDIEENTRSKGQKIAYPRYNNPQLGEGAPLYIQFPWTHMNQYGIPRLGEYYSDDSQRSFVKIPLDQSVPEIKAFSNLLKSIDDKLGSNDFKKKMFGSKGDKYVYQPIFRLPLEDEEPSKSKDKKDYGPKLPYMKLKMDTTYPDNQVKTLVYNSVMENGKRVRTKLNNINTIDDMVNNMPFLSRIRPIGRPVKLWAQAPNKKDPTYGLTFKMVKVEVEPPANKNSSYKQYLDADAFLDSENENEIEHETKPVANVQSDDSDSDVPVTKQVSQIKVDSDDESDDEVVQPVKTTTTKKVVEVESDSDEEVIPVKKVPVKGPVKSKKASN
jgi:hypothetical protein